MVSISFCKKGTLENLLFLLSELSPEAILTEGSYNNKHLRTVGLERDTQGRFGDPVRPNRV
jgi:hypothetical protein